jgi:hypothetical protein
MPLSNCSALFCKDGNGNLACVLQFVSHGKRVFVFTNDRMCSNHCCGYPTRIAKTTQDGKPQNRPWQSAIRNHFRARHN